MTEHPRAAKVQVYRDTAGEWRWRALAGNSEPVADSGEGYRHRVDASAAASSLFPDAEIQHLPEGPPPGGG
jgi:uncharacterized protein YegP (UPF0339 family)